MRRRHQLLAPVLVLGGVVSAAGGATVIDMPAAPSAARSGGEVQETSAGATEGTLGEVALDRFARRRGTPAFTSMASPDGWGWPFGRYGFGYGAFPNWGWGWGWGWGWPRGWGRGWNAWGFPYSGFSPCWGGWGFRSPFIGGRRLRHTHLGQRWRGTGRSARGARR
ncbi:MAG: hypothetical protein ACYTEI_03250 [Planctomycetota bacterium]|jgi:hypothetical protein